MSGTSQFCRGIHGWKTDDERAAFSTDTVDTNCPLVGLDDLTDKAQSKPVSVDLRIHRLTAPVKRLENVLDLVDSNTDSMIFDPDLHLSTPGRLDVGGADRAHC